MLKTFQKTIALMLSLVFIFTLVPSNVIAEVTEESVTVGFSYPFWSYTKNPDVVKDYSVGLRVGKVGNQYKGFVQLDFSGYEYLLRDDSSSLTFSIAGRRPVQKLLTSVLMLLMTVPMNMKNTTHRQV